MPNIYEPEFDEPRDHDGFRARRSRLGRQTGTRQLGASLWELPPGEAAYPYHYHLAEEELIIVLAGTPRLRTPEGWRRLKEGDLVSFPVGEEGAHQLMNDGPETARMLSISTQPGAEICVYPDSGKLGAYDDRLDGEGLAKLFRVDDAVDYWEGEEPPIPD
jgi:uncharacterized cupin superfamily protein